MKFEILNEVKETVYRWDIEADEDLVDFVVERGRERATTEDFFQIGMQSILRDAIANAEEPPTDDTIGS